jgi:hypothetical protein
MAVQIVVALCLIHVLYAAPSLFYVLYDVLYLIITSHIVRMTKIRVMMNI